MSDNPLDEKLVRVWDRDYNLRGQQFVPWNAGTFTVPADDPLAIELWDRRELGHQITVESNMLRNPTDGSEHDRLVWWIDRMDRTKDGTLIVTCRPHVDILRDCTVPDWKLIEVWLSAEKRWKSQQPSNAMRDRIAAVLYGNLRRQQGIDRPDRFLDWIDTSELADAVMEVVSEFWWERRLNEAFPDEFPPIHRMDNR